MSKHSNPFKIAIAGNPNSGKSSLFNILTGSRQKVGNFHGVTIDRKSAELTIDDYQVSVVDLPGTYSLHPNSYDERIVTRILTDESNQDYPDAVLYVADYADLESQLLLYTQIADLNIPTVIILTKEDDVNDAELQIDLDALSQNLKTAIYSVNARKSASKNKLKSIIAQHFLSDPDKTVYSKRFISFTTDEIAMIESVNGRFHALSPYGKFLLLQHHNVLKSMGVDDLQPIENILNNSKFNSVNAQINHTTERLQKIKQVVDKSIYKTTKNKTFTDKIDALLTHKYIGPVIFFGLMFLVFQAIFAWAEYPMVWIESSFAYLGEGVRAILPAGLITDLLVDGIIAGLAGVLVFIPQIAILFFFISLMEETGYMSRAVYLFDKPMQRVGLNGRSVVALISGHACAIPAIMSTRTIADWKERLITIFVTPFVSCSARIPVYTILIAFVVPADMGFLGIFNAQGAVFMGMYILGIVIAMLSALGMKLLIKRKIQQSVMLLEMPTYQKPHFLNVWHTVVRKVKTFVREAGRVIIVISILLWFVASFGMSDAMDNATQEARQLAAERNLSEQETADLISNYRLESSFAGQLGHFIEPVIKPLGYDWKIGIALITSFAAREVFVGTMSTLYNVGSSENLLRVSEQMRLAENPETGRKTFTLPVALSLLVFYALAMQCMSTLAVVKKETGGWKWPILQFIYMTGIAYFLSFITFQVASIF